MGVGSANAFSKGCLVREVHVLTVSSSLPVNLLDELLTRTESVLHEHGASRVWIDLNQPGTAVLAEFPEVVSAPVPRAPVAELSPLV